MDYKRTFIAIDLESFYASVETEEEEVNHGFRLRHFHHDDVPFLMPSYDEATTLYVFKHIPNRIFRYIVYAYICISGFIILITN